MSHKITVIINQEENWFTATCLENDITSQGKNIDEALKNLKEAVELYYEDADVINLQSNFFVTTMEVNV